MIKLFRSWKRVMNYLRQGYANYIGVGLNLANSIMLVKGLFFQEVSIWIIAPAVLLLVVPITTVVGRWDYRKGTYPELAEIGAKNSEPSRDIHLALIMLAKQNIPEEDYKIIYNRLTRWLKENEKEMVG